MQSPIQGKYLEDDEIVQSQTVSAATPKPKVTTIQNEKYSDWSWFWKGSGKSPSIIEKEYGAIKPTIAETRDFSKTKGPSAGTTIVAKDIPNDFLVGSGGAEGCVIAVISTPSTKRPRTYDVVAAHFAPQYDPQSVWNKFGNFPEGTKVAFAGGVDEYASNKQMLVTIASLAYKKGVTIEGYYRGSGLWVDNKGNYTAFKSDVPNKK